MLREKKVLAIVGVACILVASLSVVYVAASPAWTIDDMVTYMEKTGKGKLYKTLYIIKNEIKPKIDDIEDKLDKLDVEALSFEFAANPGGAGFAYIYVAVSFAGEGVTGLTAANFALYTRHVPPGYWAIEIESLHVDWGTGTYTLRVKPYGDGYWAAGDYGSELWVTSGDKKGVTLVMLTVT